MLSWTFAQNYSSNQHSQRNFLLVEWLLYCWRGGGFCYYSSPCSCTVPFSLHPIPVYCYGNHVYIIPSLSLTLQTHWHSFFVMSDMESSMVLKSTEGTSLHQAPLSPTILPLPARNGNIFKWVLLCVAGFSIFHHLIIIQSSINRWPITAGWLAGWQSPKRRAVDQPVVVVNEPVSQPTGINWPISFHLPIENGTLL